jgi:hypothetical protein
VRVWLGNLKERDYLEDLGIDVRIILRVEHKTSSEGCELDFLAQDKDWWQALVNTLMNLQVA